MVLSGTYLKVVHLGLIQNFAANLYKKKPFQNLLDTFIKDLSSSDFKSF